MKTQLFTVLAAGALFSASPAHAALTMCDSGTAGSVMTLDASARSGGCEFLDDGGNDSLSMVNDEAFFGFDDWKFDSKDNDLDGSDEGANGFGISFTGGLQSGAFSFSGDLSGMQIMMVFKGGGKNTSPSSVIAYMLDVATSGGTFTTPFQNKHGTGQDVSHVSVYFREVAEEVPLPAAAWLMGAGLAGLGLFRRKAKAA